MSWLRCVPKTGSAVPRPVLDRYEFIRRRLRLDYQSLDRTVVTDAKWLASWWSRCCPTP